MKNFQDNFDSVIDTEINEHQGRTQFGFTPRRKSPDLNLNEELFELKRMINHGMYRQAVDRITYIMLKHVHQEIQNVRKPSMAEQFYDEYKRQKKVKAFYTEIQRKKSNFRITFGPS